MKKMLSIGLLIALASMAYGQTAGIKRASLENKDKAADVNAPKITAAGIVRAVRESESWLGRVDSLILRVESRMTLTPEQIEGAIAESRAITVIKHDPNSLKLDPSQDFKKSFPSINIYELAFDQNRYRYVSKGWARSQITIWDGKQSVEYAKDFNPVREAYFLYPTLELIKNNHMFEIINWPRAQLLSFWWDSAANDCTDGSTKALREVFPPDKKFILKGTTNYRGIDCYILEYLGLFPSGNYPSYHRWYVGIKDKLLYGRLYLSGDKITREYWTTDYKEVAPGCFFPMKQGGIIDSTFYDRGKTEKIYNTGSQTDIEITEIRVNEKLPDELFRMDFKEGVKVFDNHFGIKGFTYPYKSNRTEDELNQIQQEAREKAKNDIRARKHKDSFLNKPAPAFPKGAEWLNSRPLTWKDLRGKVVILEFWAEWCGPCKNDLPVMSELHKKREENKIIVIGIHVLGSRPDAIQKVIKEYDIDYPICIDIPVSHPIYGLMSNAYDVGEMPYAYVIDRNGKVAGHGWGVADVIDTAVRLANKPSNQNN